MAEEIQDRMGYTIFYPKNMDKMDYDKLKVVYNETMEAIEFFVRNDVFKAYYKSNSIEKQEPFEPGEE